ncbi:MAG TPA: FxsA family protein, partial [Propionibacteriaceae bacterium]|nr:FxsA family protein [Propionibacteriaceae bacterium]
MRLRHGWPLALLALLLIAIPILEVWLLVQVGQWLGLLPTVLILIVEAVIGVLLMRHEGSRAWKALNDAFTNGKVPTGELADAALILVGGVLLMLPGFLTDIIGFLFLLRWSRPLARKVIAFFVARRINRLGIPVMRARLDRENLIEGETVETPSTSRRRPQDPTIIAGE